MIPRKLRLKIIASIIGTCAVIAVFFGAILYPFEMTRRQSRLEKIELLLSAVFQQKEEQVANEIFAGQRDALAQSVEEMQRVKGMAAITVYHLNGALLMSTAQFPTVVLSESERRALDSTPSFVRETRTDPSVAVYSAVIEVVGEKLGYLKMSYDLSDMEQESTLFMVFFITLMILILIIMSVFLNYFLVRSVIRPVSVLRDAMRQVQEGRFGEQLEMTSRDEIGEMAEAFNDMSAQLKEKHAALTAAIEAQELYAHRLEETNKELERLNLGLENIVAERTGELSESNRQLLAEVDERVRAEVDLATEKERLSVTLSSIGDGVITTDTAGRIVLTNKVAGHLTGWRRDEAAGRPVMEVFRIWDESSVGQYPVDHPVHAALKNGRPLSPNRSVALYDRRGRAKMISYNVAPIRDAGGQVIGAVLVFRDVTEQSRMAQEAQKSAKLESVGILAGGIAHDFNNIMTAILGNLSLARMYTAPGEKTHEKLFEAEKAILHAKGLTRQLLTFSKGGAPIKTTTSVKELLTDTTNFALSGSNVRCRFAIDDDLWPLNIDATQISQVINNLVINAVQAMPGGGEVRVAAENQALGESDEYLGLPRGSFVVITITDGGMGIAEDLQTKVFDPYFTTKEKGSGLGLSTSYAIVKNHGGMVDLESGAGEGTTFRVWLPAGDKGDIGEPVDQDVMIRGKGRILLMDDEEDILGVTSEALDLLGYSVDTAMDGRQAIEKYIRAMEANQPYDALIMDLTIPGGMGGKETIRRLRKIDPDVKAVVSSGYSQDPVMAEYEKFGFAGVLPKPFRLEEMSQVLGWLLRA